MQCLVRKAPTPILKLSRSWADAVDYIDEETGDVYTLVVEVDRASLWKNDVEVPGRTLNFKRPPTEREQREYLESAVRNMKAKS